MVMSSIFLQQWGTCIRVTTICKVRQRQGCWFFLSRNPLIWKDFVWAVNFANPFVQTWNSDKLNFWEFSGSLVGLKGNVSFQIQHALKYILFLFLVLNNDILCVLDCIQWKHKDMFLWQISNHLDFEEKKNIDIPILANHCSMDFSYKVFDMGFHSVRLKMAND